LCTFGPVIGPATSIAGEVSGTRLRAKSQAIGFVVPYMFNPDQGNLGGKIGWIYAATCLTAIVIVYFEFPETKNRTYIELDHMFDMRLSSRNFAGFVVPHSTTAP
jgi:MFS transporter, SP family, general alpha glucoside:H+ symporter